VIGADGAGSVVRQGMEKQVSGFTVTRKTLPNYRTMIALDRLSDQLDETYLHALATRPFCVAGAIAGDEESESPRWFCAIGTRRPLSFATAGEARAYLRRNCPRVLDLTSEGAAPTSRALIEARYHLVEADVDDQQRSSWDAQHLRPTSEGKAMAMLSTTGEQIVQATTQLPAAEQREVLNQILAANKDLRPAADAYNTRIWMLLLGGLFAVALVAIICTVVLEARDSANDTTALIAITSAVIAGVIGLFSNPPTR
jgi:hypothetical protein